MPTKCNKCHRWQGYNCPENCGEFNAFGVCENCGSKHEKEGENNE